MSKTRQISSQTNNQTAKLESSYQVKSTGDSQLFSDLFKKSHVEQMETDNDAKEDKDNEDKKTDINQLQSKKVDKTKKSKKTSETDESDEVSAEEKKEIDEMEQYELNVKKLADQLDVALNTAQVDTNEQVKALNHNVEVRFVDDRNQLKEVADSVEPNLLRRVDVQTLEEQINKMIDKDSVRDVEVPQALNKAIEVQGEKELDNEKVNLEEIQQKFIAHFENKNEDVSEDLASQSSAITQVTTEEIEEFTKESIELEEVDENSLRFEEEKVESVSELELDRDLVQAKDETENSAKNFEVEDFTDALAGLKEKSEFDLSQFTKSDKSKFQFLMNSEGQNHLSNDAKLEDVILNDMQLQFKENSNHQIHNISLQKPGLTEGALTKVNIKIENTIFEMASSGKSGVTKIHMNPETLGKIEIRLEIHEKTVRAKIITDNLDAKESIIKHLPHIKEVLASENFNLDYFNAKHDENYFAAQQHFQEQSSANQGQGENASQFARQFSDGHRQGESEVASQLKEVIKSKAQGNGLINVRV